MAETLAVSLVTLLCVISIYKAFALRSQCIRQRVAENKFRLYAVRDQLIGLIADERVEENDDIFRLYYQATNDIVRRQHKFTMFALIKRAMDERAAKIQSAKFIEELSEELSKRDPALRDAVLNFYRALLDIVIANSVTLRFFLRFHDYVNPIMRLAKRIYTTLPNLRIVMGSWMDAYQLGRTSEFALSHVSSQQNATKIS